MFGLEKVLEVLKLEGESGGVAFAYDDWPAGTHLRYEPDDFVPPAGWTAVPYAPTQDEMVLPKWRKYTRV